MTVSTFMAGRKEPNMNAESFSDNMIMSKNLKINSTFSPNSSKTRCHFAQ